MKKILTIMAMACCVSASHAADLVSTQSGALNVASTWGGTSPVAGDSLTIVNGHEISLQNPFSAGVLELQRGVLDIQSSGALTGHLRFLGRQPAGSSTVTINGGSLWSTASTVAGEGAGLSMTMNGGTAVFDEWLLLKEATITINNGAVLSVPNQQLAFEGSGDGQVFLNSGGALSVNWVQFQDNSLLGLQKISIDGGVMTVTTPNENGSFAFDSPNASVQFDSGSIVWKGVDSPADYATFAATFKGWVDAGKFTSSTLSSQELKHALVYNGIDAYLVYAALPKTTLHVALDGNDNSSGQSIDAPLASLAGARNRIRSLRAGGLQGSVEVLVRGGVYYESPTLVLEKQDSGTWGSPVVYKAYPGEKPVFSGGRRIPSPSPSDGQYRVTVPGAWGRQWPFRQLFIDDLRYTLARSPNEGYYSVQGIPPEPAGSYYGAPYWFAHNFIYKPGDLKNWSTLSSGEINLRVYSLWEAQTIPLTSVDESNNTAFSATHVLWGYTPNETIAAGGISKRYVVENAPDSLDAPGEWYLNRATGLLTIIPFASEDLSQKTLVAPVTQQAILINGDADANQFVEHIRFEGIAFKHYATPPLPGGLNGGWRSSQAATYAAGCISITGARFIEFIRCELSHVGTHGIRFGRGCVLNLVEQCHLYDLGGGGIYIGEFVTFDAANWYDPGTYGSTSHNIIYNNYIHDGGILHDAGVGIIIGQSFDNLIWHNEIAHFNWSGMQIGWNWNANSTYTFNNRIEYNHIHDIGQNVLSDLGGIYTVGENLNTIIGNNVIHDIYCWVEANGRGLYADENTSGVTFRNNLIYNTGAQSFGINYCRDIIVRNNVFAMNYGKATFNFGSNVDATITNNIFYIHYGNIYTDNNDQFNPAWIREMNNNLYWRIDGEPVTYAPTDILFSLWKSLTGLDSNSLEADPMFRDPENGDFSFTNTQNANAIGFVSVDWTQSGLIGTADWVDLPESFERTRSYRVYYEEWPGHKTYLPRKASDTFMGMNGASVVESGGQEYGAVTYSRIKVPLNVNDLGVRASSNLLTPLNNWSSLTGVHSVTDDDVITESVTIRDDVPVSTSKSRFYRIRGLE